MQASSAAGVRPASDRGEAVLARIPVVPALLAVVAAAAAAATAFLPGVLRGTAVMNGSARGTAVVVLFVAVPVLVVALATAARGSARAWVVALGAIAYLTYNAVLLLLATPFNALFLLYTTMFALSVWSAVFVFPRLHVEQFAARFGPRAPIRLLAGYLAAVAVLNAAAWLVPIVPALFATRPPAFLDGTGLTTNPVYVQDLSFWIPLMVVTVVAAWRRVGAGLALLGALLVFGVIESVGIAVDQWLGHAADPASNVASAALTPVFGVWAAIGMVPVVLYFRSWRSVTP